MNKYSLSLGKISGIPIFVHWSFSAIFIYIIYVGVSRDFGVWGTAWYMALILCLFGCVLLHELGHSLSARKYGIGTEDITLLPIGGLARLQRMPKEPMQELVIAIMGPMVNVVIASVLIVIYILFFDNFLGNIDIPGPFTLASIIAKIILLNIVLVVFNMIPAFPMDGGRVFRALLSFKLDYVKATKIASFVGKAAALGFIGLGFYLNDFLLMGVGGYVYYSGNRENQMVSMEGQLEGHTIKELIRDRFTVFQTTDSIRSVMKALTTSLETNFLVLENNNVEGIVTKEMITEEFKINPDKQLKEVMRTDVSGAHPEQSLLEGLEIIRSFRQPILPVFDQASRLLLGVLDYHSLFKFIEIKKSGQK